MTRRLTEWKFLKNDEEAFFEGKSEVLWSREKSECFSEEDFFDNVVNNFSDVTGRTVSSCSWHNDEFDMKSTNKVRDSLEAVENALYERKCTASMSDELFNECCNWSQRFPYLRLKGDQIINNIDEDIMPCSTTSLPIKSCNQCNNFSCLLLEGKKMTIHNSSQFQTKTLEQSAIICQALPGYDKEVLEDLDQYEDCFVLDESCAEFCGQEDCNSHCCRNKVAVKNMYEKIIEKLAFLLWPKVIATLQGTVRNSSEVRLPPISSVTDQQASTYLQRPQTEGQKYGTTDISKLDDILTVSAKILQHRKEYRSGSGLLRVPRPTSDIALLNRNFDSFVHDEKFSSYEAVMQQKTKPIHSVPLNKTPFTKTKKNLEEVSDAFQHFLPALQEDSVDSTTVTSRMHNETSTNELPSLLGDKFNQISCISVRSEGFLPPIRDKNSFPDSKINQKCVSTRLAPAKVSNPSSRVNSSTSSSRKIYTNNSLKAKFVLNEDLPGKKTEKKPSFIHFNEYNSFLDKKDENYKNLCDGDMKAITLFPIVTSLTPKREKSSSNDRKEGTFMRKKT